MSAAGTGARRASSLPASVAASLRVALVAAVCACVLWAARSTWQSVDEAAHDAVRALWVVPGLIAVHLMQLLLSGFAWRTICGVGAGLPGLGTFFRLRLIREGIDSLLPVAQIGGEVVGARLLAARGVDMAAAGASVIVDLTMELVGQLLFLLTGLAALAALSGETRWMVWLQTAGGLALMAAGFLAAQRFGVLRIIEVVVDGIARRFPALGGGSLAGLEAAALRCYRHPRRVARAMAVHALSWSLGTIETWVVLRASGIAATPAQALVIESLGMAARSAGFAIPGALGAQEGGFMLAAAAIGLPTAPALTVSVIKRVREVAVGALGLWLWRGGLRRSTDRPPRSEPLPRRRA